MATHNRSGNLKNGKGYSIMREELKKFETVYKNAYGWSITPDGYLAGLTSGDSHYEVTDKKINDLVFESLVLCENTSTKNKIRSALADLVEYTYDGMTTQRLSDISKFNDE
jgi:hypothetical protein